MKPSEVLQVHKEEVKKIILSHRVINARVFGSVSRGEDTENSDLDILVDPCHETTLMDIAAIRHELRELLGVRVDVLTPRALPVKHRDRIVREAIPL